jgi:histidinol-phosphate aminotransferase
MSGQNPYASLAAEAITALSPYEPGMPPEALEREYGISNAIKLASNENAFGLPAAVRAAMDAELNRIGRYPDGGGFALRGALAEHLSVAPEQITLGNGSNEVLVLLAETFLTAATAAVYDQYSFVVYRLAVQAVGAHALVAASHPAKHEQPFGHDLGAMLSLVDDATRLVFIANPNNPTGTWFGQAALRSFLQQLPEHVIAIVDEAYYEYACGDDFPDTLPLLKEFPNLVVVRTFSKAYGLAGLRVGYCISASGIAELLNRVRQPFNVNSVAQAGAVAALGEQGWVIKCHELNDKLRAALRTALAKLGINCLPAKGNFLLAHIGADAAACHEFLLRNGVIVRPVANYGLPEYLRITIGTQDETERLLAVLGDYCGNRS